MSEYKIYLGDCLLSNLGRRLEKVDTIIADPPYGTTAAAWDTVIPFSPMWAMIERWRKDTAPVVLFGSEPFSSKLRLSNIDNYKYDWIWEKERGANIFTSKIMPQKVHEIISVFYGGTYNPQMEYRAAGKGAKSTDRDLLKSPSNGTETIGKTKYKYADDYNPSLKYPRSIKKFRRDHYIKRGHGTAKPLELMKYLVLTHSNPGDTVLDFTMGSGTTGAACAELGRNFIGIEQDPKYFAMAEQRIQRAYAQGVML